MENIENLKKCITKSGKMSVQEKKVCKLFLLTIFVENCNMCKFLASLTKLRLIIH